MSSNNSQKRENLLNMSLDVTRQERMSSPALSTGYDPGTRTWELIVRYSGDLSPLKDMGVEVKELLNGYAILNAPEELVETVSQLEQIQYMEKPKLLYFAVNTGRSASCLTAVQSGPEGLSGEGVLTAVIDSGIDYFHPDFRNEDGSTRILELWDQEKGIFSREQINEALRTDSRPEALELVPSVDLSGHGTAVAGIAAGNGRESGGLYRGVAWESPLLIVRLGASSPGNFPRTTQMMEALDYTARRGMELSMPTAVNLSFGNTYGSHDGTSLLETFIDSISNYGRMVICVGTGNEGTAGGHISGSLRKGEMREIELAVAEYETEFSLQIWKDYADDYEIFLITPSGEESGPVSRRLGLQTFRYRNTTVLLYYGEPSPYSSAQEIYLIFQPARDYVDSGIWTIRLIPVRLVSGRYDLWLPVQSALNTSTRFLTPNPDRTLTIPSTAWGVISVGAYNDSYQSYAAFSGRGGQDARIKPDLVAPGVDLVAPRVGGGYEEVTGTSFAAPFVTGSAALLMEWGIIRGNDPYLYGEKVKAYLRRGARQLPGYDAFPNPQVGYGALCVEDSLPE